MTALTWIATIITIIGSILNSQKRIEGFYLWIISNSVYVYINLYLGITAQAVLFAFNTFICIWGLCTWRKKK